MNLLIFSEYSPYESRITGGAEVSLRLIAERFARIGESVYFVTLALEKLPGKTKSRTINGVTIHTLRPVWWPTLRGRLFPGLRTRWLQHRIRHFLADIIRKQNIDLAITSNFFPGAYDLLYLRDRYHFNFKTVLRTGGLPWTYQIGNNGVTPEKVEWIFNNVDSVNFVSRGFRDLFHTVSKKYQIRPSPRAEVVLDIGVDPERFPGTWIPHERPVFKIVCVARLSRLAKRHGALINAMKSVRNGNIRLDLVGGGPMRKAYAKRVRELGLEDRVTLYGHVPHESIPGILSEADLFALPTEREGLGKAMLEAMATGLPCLVSDVPALNTLIKEGINGYLCANTPRDWAAKIEALCRKRNEMNGISERAKEFIRSRYDAARNIFAYKAEFERLVHGPDRPI